MTTSTDWPMLVPAALTGACQAVAPLGRCLVGGLENDRNTCSIPILVCLPQKYEMIPRCPADNKIERRKSMRHPSTENHVRFLLQRSERHRVIARDKYLNPASCRSCMPRTGSSPHPLTNRSIYGRTSHRASHDQAARPQRQAPQPGLGRHTLGGLRRWTPDRLHHHHSAASDLSL